MATETISWPRTAGATPQKMPNLKSALSTAAGGSWSASTTIPDAFFNREIGDIFIGPLFSGRCPLVREKDQKVGGVNCYVVSGELDLSKLPNAEKPGSETATLWIGKEDLLIHQSRTRYKEKMDTSPTATDKAIDEAIKQSLEAQKKPVTPEAIAAMRPQMKAIMKQVQSTLKSGFESGIVFTQTHDHIVVNEKVPFRLFSLVE